jgi:hypothetical protein
MQEGVGRGRGAVPVSREEGGTVGEEYDRWGRPVSDRRKKIEVLVWVF